MNRDFTDIVEVPPVCGPGCIVHGLSPGSSGEVLLAGYYDKRVFRANITLTPVPTQKNLAECVFGSRTAKVAGEPRSGDMFVSLFTPNSVRLCC